MIAVSRLLLDNIPNIKAYWIMMGLPMAQLALHFGANDVDGTITDGGVSIASGLTGNEKVVVLAGAFLNPGDKVKPVVQKSSQ